MRDEERLHCCRYTHTHYIPTYYLFYTLYYVLYVRHTHTRAYTLYGTHREHIIIIFIYSRRRAACSLFVHPPTEIVAEESDRTVKRDFEPNRTRVKRYIEYLIRVYYYLVFLFGRTIFTHKYCIPTYGIVHVIIFPQCIYVP